MADHKIVVEDLHVDLYRAGVAGDRATKPVLTFTANGETWEIEIAALPCVELYEVFRQLHYAMTLEERMADLVVEDHLSVSLDRKPVEP